MAERITSRTNPLMTHIRKLSASRSYREKTGEYLGDGVKLLEEAVRWGADLTCVVFTPGISLPPLPAGVRLVEIPRMSWPPSAPWRPHRVPFSWPGGRTHPCLRSFQAGDIWRWRGSRTRGMWEPSLRSADAFEADGLILLPGCADPYGPKTVRASMGAVFRRPVWTCALGELLPRLREADLPLWGAALREDTADARVADLSRGVLLIGSEGRGLSGEALAACGGTVKIPMSSRCESLNAAVAAAILLWEGYRESCAIDK